MFEYTGRIVRSEAGHDKGTYLCVMGVSESLLLLADGKRRRVEAPKRKKCGHVSRVVEFEHPVLTKLQNGESVTNRELRTALAVFRDQGGN